VTAKSLVEHFLLLQHLLPVRFVKTVLILLLTLVWAAASNHCKLEQVPGLTFLACADHAEETQDIPSQDEGCDTDGCSFEVQLYKTENAQASAPAPLFLFTLFLNPLLHELVAPATTSHILPDAAPVVLTRVWQFSYRTALPPRAPSLLS
jgi:hypothetical protein